MNGKLVMVPRRKNTKGLQRREDEELSPPLSSLVEKCRKKRNPENSHFKWSLETIDNQK